jgi:hypothetical protein
MSLLYPGKNNIKFAEASKTVRMLTLSWMPGKESRNNPFGTCKQDCNGCYGMKAFYAFPRNIAGLQQRTCEAIHTSVDEYAYRFANHVKRNYAGQDMPVLIRASVVGEPPTLDVGRAIAEACAALGGAVVRLYGYTKWEMGERWPVDLPKNMNIITSQIGHHNLNYGNWDYCMHLVNKHGAWLCPCGIDKRYRCMVECSYCLDGKSVCFLQH